MSAYRYFKISITTVKGPGNNQIQFADWNVYYNNNRIDYSRATATWVGGALFGDGAVSNGIDNNPSTKFGANSNSGIYTIDFGSPQNMNSYNYTTANDSTVRDPISWIIYVSNDNITFNTIDVQSNVSITDTRLVQTQMFSFLLPSPITNYPCFKEGSRILTNHGYVLVENLRTGDLVQTFRNGLVPIAMIGYRDLEHRGAVERIKDQLYICPVGEDFPGLFSDLVLTGCHSLLANSFRDIEEVEKVKGVLGRLYTTDDLYRIPACVDMRTVVYSEVGGYRVYHLALENSDYYMNYGIYANGLLVESCSKRYLKELSGMTLL